MSELPLYTRLRGQLGGVLHAGVVLRRPSILGAHWQCAPRTLVQGLQRYLARKNPPPSLGPPYGPRHGPRHRPTVGSNGGGGSYERGIPVLVSKGTHRP